MSDLSKRCTRLLERVRALAPDAPRDTELLAEAKALVMEKWHHDEEAKQPMSEAMAEIYPHLKRWNVGGHFR